MGISVLNATLVSFAMTNLFSMSAFHTFNSFRTSKQSLAISNSFFSHSISNIIQAHNKNFNLYISKTQISHTLSSAIFLGHADEEDTRCSIGKMPYTSFLQLEKINGFHNWNDNSDYDHHLFVLSPECGDSIIILKCLFHYCYCADDSLRSGGGAIYANYSSHISISRTIFDRCYTNSIRGGALMITGGANSYALDYSFNDFLTSEIDIKYCCFQNCYGLNDVYGAAAFLAGKITTLDFVSSVNCSDIYINYGAQFDIQADIVKSINVNVTGGKSIYCGAIEYRSASFAIFRFNTLRNLSSGFVVAFSKVKNSRIHHCNLVKNTKQQIKDSAIFYLAYESVDIFSFYFVDCNFSQLLYTFDYYEPFEDVKPRFVDCYSNKMWVETKDMEFINCSFGFSNLTSDFQTLHLEHLMLLDCQGERIPETFIFSQSNLFTISEVFMPSNKFTCSNQFTLSNNFSSSNHFSLSNLFSRSIKFTDSNSFTRSDVFTDSNQFPSSDEFSASSTFTASNQFSSSNQFSASSTFTGSNTFTPSDGFTPSVLVDYNDDEKEKGIYETYSSSQTVSYVLSVSYSITQRITYFYSYTMINEEMTNTLFSTIEESHYLIIIESLITAHIRVKHGMGINHSEHLSASLIIGIVFGAGGLFLIISILLIFIIKRKQKYHQLIKPKSIQDHDDLYTSSDFRSDEAYERETETNRRKSENIHNNPLFNEHCIDDPFANDFDNQD